MADDTTASVKITADASGVKPGVDQAKGEIEGMDKTIAALNAGMAELSKTMQEGFASVNASIAGSTVEMAKLEEETESEGVSLKEMAASAHESLEAIVEMREAMSGFAEVFMAAFAVEAIVDWTKEFAEASEKVEHMAQTFGMTTTQIQDLNSIATLSGVSIDTIARAMQTLDRNAVQAAEGNSAVATAFKAVGISANDGASNWQRLMTIADKFSHMDDGPKKVALAMELLGKNGAALIPVLNEGAEALNKQKEIGEEYSAASAEAGDTADRAQKSGMALAESINVTKLAWQGVTNVLGDAFGPVLKEITDSLNVAIKAFIDSYTQGGLVAEIFTAISTVVEETGAIINALAGIFVDLWDSVSEVSASIGRAIGETFGVIFPTEMQRSQLAMALFKDALELLKDGWIVVIETMKTGLLQLVTTCETAAKMAEDAFHLNWSGVATDWNNGFAKLEQEGKDWAAKMKSIAADVNTTIANAVQGKGPATTGGEGISEPKGPKDFDPGLGKTDKDKAPKSRMDGWEEKLEESKLAWAQLQDQQGTAEAYSLTDTVAYWAQILQRDDLSTQERLGVTKAWLAADSQLVKQRIQVQLDSDKARLEAAKGDADKQLQIAQDLQKDIVHYYGAESTEAAAARATIVQYRQRAAEQQKAIADDLYKHEEQLALGEIDADQKNAQFEVQMGRMTQAQLIEIEQQAEDRKWAIQQQAFAKEIAAAGQDKTAKSKAEQDQLVAYQVYQSKKTQLAQQAELQRTAIERNAISQTSSAWGSALGKLLTFQQGFAATLKQLYQGIQQAIGNALGQILTNWLTQHITTLLLGSAASKSAGLAEISTQAAIAGAGGVASMAAAPFPLDLGAPEFGASMAAAAMGFTSLMTVPGFDTGAYNLSKDQLAMVHSGEMIIPADQAGGWRSMMSMMAGMSPMTLPASLSSPMMPSASTSGSSPTFGPSAPGGGDTHHHYHIQAMDSQDVKRFFTKHATKIATAGNQGVRMGVMPKR